MPSKDLPKYLGVEMTRYQTWALVKNHLRPAGLATTVGRQTFIDVQGLDEWLKAGGTSRKQPR